MPHPLRTFLSVYCFRMGPWAFAFMFWISAMAWCSCAPETSVTDDSGSNVAQFPAAASTPPHGRPPASQTLPAGARVVGDMVFVGGAPTEPKFRGQGVASAQAARRWPVRNGKITVPYVVAASNAVVRGRLAQAIAHWEAEVCVAFVDVTQDRTGRPADYVEVVDDSACRATVGRVGGRQNVWLSPDCSVRSVVHELGHALGLLHTHTRWDRDQWIVYHAANVQSDARDNYDLDADALALGPYDYDSVMHYRPYSFHNGGGATMDSPRQVGARDTLSAADILAVEWLHNDCADGPQTQIRCTNNYGTWAYAVRPGARFAVNIIAYYDPEPPTPLAVNYTLPQGAQSDVPNGLRVNGSAHRMIVSWTPSQAQLGTHTIATTWTAAGGAPTRACDFRVEVAVGACDGHLPSPTDCSGHGRCTMRSMAWPCSCGKSHYGRLCEYPYRCGTGAIREDFAAGFGALTGGWNTGDISVGDGRMAVRPGADRLTARAHMGIDMTVRTMSVRVRVAGPTAASGTVAELMAWQRSGPSAARPLMGLRVTEGELVAVMGTNAIPVPGAVFEADMWYDLTMDWDYDARQTTFSVGPAPAGPARRVLTWHAGVADGGPALHWVSLGSYAHGAVVLFDDLLVDCTRPEGTTTFTATPTGLPTHTSPPTATPTPAPTATLGVHHTLRLEGYTLSGCEGLPGLSLTFSAPGCQSIPVSGFTIYTNAGCDSAGAFHLSHCFDSDCSVPSSGVCFVQSIAPMFFDVIPSMKGTCVLDTGGCTDSPTNWADAGGYTCAAYSENNYCTTGGVGLGWRSSWGTFADYATGGKDASQACCACGGGEASGSATSTATGVPTETPPPTATTTTFPTTTALPTMTASSMPSGTPSPTSSPVDCCSNITLAGAEDVQRSRMGEFVVVPSTTDQSTRILTMNTFTIGGLTRTRLGLWAPTTTQGMRGWQANQTRTPSAQRTPPRLGGRIPAAPGTSERILPRTVR